jgi:voltage-dependent calcium channel T type alpha-1G
LIAINSIALALDEPTLANNSYEHMTLNQIENAITGVFIFEACSKIIVQGFVIGQGTYLRDSWNILDFLIVLTSIVNWIVDHISNVSIGFLRGFRALRALRPLRMVSKNEGMKLVVNALLTAIPSLVNVMLVCLLFLFVFSILGI